MMAASPARPSCATILNVDDTDAMRYLKTRVLQRAGYHVIEATTGRAALSLAETEVPDLIVLDIRLPDIDGFEVCRLLKDNPLTAHIKVLHASVTKVTPQDRAKGLDEGADGYLVAPVEDEELLSTVRALLKLGQQERDNQSLIHRLSHTERQLREATEAANCGMWDWDIASGRLEWFGAHEQLAGIRPGSFTGKIEVFQNILHPDDRIRVWQTIQNLINRRETQYADEYRFVHPDGSAHWMAGTGRLFYDGQGRAVRMTGVVQDITPRKQAEAALQRRNRQLELLALASQRLLLGSEFGDEPLATIFEDIGGLIDMEKFYHYRPSEEPRLLRLQLAGGVTDEERVLFATIPYGEHLCGRVAERRERLIVEDLQQAAYPGSEVLRAAGATGYAGFPLLVKGELVGTIAFISNQCTRLCAGDVQLIQTVCDQIAIALERTQLQRALRESEERLRLALEGADLGSWDVDVSTGRACWNRRHTIMKGYEFENGPVSIQKWKDRVHPDDLHEVLRAIERARQDRALFAVEHRILPADTDELRWLSLYGRFAYNERGEAVRFSGVSLDVTERKQAEVALRVAQERLHHWNVELEQTVNRKTAELQQSQERLRALASELNLAEQRERKRLAAELHDHLQQMLVFGKLTIGQGKRHTKAAPGAAEVLEKVDRVLSDALTYSRTLVAELSPPALCDHGLAAALKWLADYMKQKHDQTVTVHVPDDAELNLSEEQHGLLFQSVRELLINSCKHAATGAATVTMERVDGSVCIRVSDRGKGFDLAAAAAAAAAAVGTPGSGISSKFGLFSIQERMRALGGSFDIQTSPGRGTTATLVVPITLYDSREETSGQTRHETGVPDSHYSSRLTSHPSRVRVLLVDDHTMVRQGLRAILDSYTDIHLVGEAGNGEEAVRLVDQCHPDVVVMDISMPTMNGIDATTRIKRSHPETRIIGLSVNADGGNQEAMTRAGALRLLTKESAVEQLYDAIRNAMTPPAK